VASGESDQLERTLEAEAALEEQGDAAREELIAAQVERLVLRSGLSRVRRSSPWSAVSSASATTFG